MATSGGAGLGGSGEFLQTLGRVQASESADRNHGNRIVGVLGEALGNLGERGRFASEPELQGLRAGGAAEGAVAGEVEEELVRERTDVGTVRFDEG